MKRGRKKNNVFPYPLDQHYIRWIEDENKFNSRDLVVALAIKNSKLNDLPKYIPGNDFIKRLYSINNGHLAEYFKNWMHSFKKTKTNDEDYFIEKESCSEEDGISSDLEYDNEYLITPKEAHTIYKANVRSLKQLSQTFNNIVDKDRSMGNRIKVQILNIMRVIEYFQPILNDLKSNNKCINNPFHGESLDQRFVSVRERIGERFCDKPSAEDERRIGIIATTYYKREFGIEPMKRPLKGKSYYRENEPKCVNIYPESRLEITLDLAINNVLL